MELCSAQQETFKYLCFELVLPAGVCCGPCNPSKWEARIWGWFEDGGSAAALCVTLNLSSASTWTLWGNPGWPGCLRKCDSGQGKHPAAQSARRCSSPTNQYRQTKFPLCYQSSLKKNQNVECLVISICLHAWIQTGANNRTFICPRKKKRILWRSRANSVQLQTLLWYTPWFEVFGA
jgi:hypothetical protein